MTKSRIFIIPGNGNSHIESDNWYAWVRDMLQGKGYEVIAHDMPDADAAHANIWLPYIENELSPTGADIMIGHSSGAVAILRYLELHQLYGAIIVGANYTDLGDEVEKESGYYNDPWQWAKIRSNANWIAQFASTDDPYIPVEQPRFIHEKLDTEYFELHDRGHFMVDHNPINTNFPEIIQVIDDKLS